MNPIDAQQATEFYCSRSWVNLSLSLLIESDTQCAVGGPDCTGHADRVHHIGGAWPDDPVDFFHTDYAEPVCSGCCTVAEIAAVEVPGTVDDPEVHAFVLEQLRRHLPVKWFGIPPERRQLLEGDDGLPQLAPTHGADAGSVARYDPHRDAAIVTAADGTETVWRHSTPVSY